MVLVLVLSRVSVFCLLVLVGPGAAMTSPTYGSLRSPNFPDPYPRETERRWNISVPCGFRVRLSFSHFHLEPSHLCEYDYVKVRRGDRTTGLRTGPQRVHCSPHPTLSLKTETRSWRECVLL